MKSVMKVKKWLTRLVYFDWLTLLRKIASAFAPGLEKLGEVLVVSGAAALGLKGADSNMSFLAVDFSKIDTWWAVAVVVAGLVIWALATFFSGKEPCNGSDD